MRNAQIVVCKNCYILAATKDSTTLMLPYYDNHDKAQLHKSQKGLKRIENEYSPAQLEIRIGEFVRPNFVTHCGCCETVFYRDESVFAVDMEDRRHYG